MDFATTGEIVAINWKEVVLVVFSLADIVVFTIPEVVGFSGNNCPNSDMVVVLRV